MTGRIIRGAFMSLSLGLIVGCVPAGGEEEETDSTIRDTGPAILLDSYVPVDFGAGGAGGEGGEGGQGGEGGVGGEGGAGGEGGVGGEGGMGGMPGPMGNADCRTLDACLRACDNADCSRMCREMAPDEGADLYDAIFLCARESGCTEPGGTLNEPCMEANCSAERLACFGPPAPPEPLDCAGLNACLGTCADGDAECTDSCNGAATDAARQRFQGLVQCFENAACAPEDAACRNGACADFLEGCFGEAVVPIGDDDCNTLAGCINGCPDGDGVCTNGCFAASSPEAFNTYQAALDCLRAAEAQCPAGDQECTQMICADEIAACIPPIGPMGDLTCEEFDDCLRECPDNDQPCVNACVTATSQVGYDQYVAFVDCINMQCPEGSAPSCVLVSCEPIIEACLGPVAVPRGVGGCSSFNDCLGTCGPDDQACTDRCIESTSARGYDLLLTAINCVQDSGCAPDDGACQQLNCGAQIQACFNDF